MAEIIERTVEITSSEIVFAMCDLEESTNHEFVIGVTVRGREQRK